MTQKKTHEEFVEQVFEMVKEEYSVLDVYHSAHSKIKLRHNNESCDFHEYFVAPNSFLKGARCIKCSGKMKKTQDIFINEIIKLVGDEYTVLGTYKTAMTKIEFRHNNESCGNYRWMVKPNHFIASGSRCPKCSGKLKSNIGEFKEKVKTETNGEYQVTGEEYINGLTPIGIIHTICNHHFFATPSNFLHNKTRCPKCFGNIKFDISTLKERVRSVVGEEYVILGDTYIDIQTKIEMKHMKCQYEFYVAPNNFLNSGSRCPKCSGLMKSDIETFKEKVRDAVGDEYTIVGSIYVNSHTPIEIIHKKCNHSYCVSPSAFLRTGNRCPQCASSKGEGRIFDLLNILELKYKPQYRIKECKDKKPLPFDFAIFDNDNKLKMLIEYDGVQHSKPIDFFGGEKGYKLLKKRDDIKNEYCKSKGINLLRVAYTELNNIEYLVKTKLKEENIVI